jgi:hypothetical protein
MRPCFFLNGKLKAKNMYQYEERNKDQDVRSNFANMIFDLIYEKNEVDVEECIKEAEPFIVHMIKHDLIRNIYELASSEIPMMGYYELKKNGADNYGFTQEEYIEYLDLCGKAIHEYHRKK